jgi:hypothetical protein
MRNVKFIYLYFLSGVLLLIISGAFYATENSNLTPVFASIGFAIISISFVLLNRANNCKSKTNE